MRSVKYQGYETPTQVQQNAIPVALEGRDVMGIAPTGTGKTAAFTMPTLQRLSNAKGKGIRALILAPTRELALQVEESLSTYGHHLPLKSGVIMGGVKENPQIKMLKRGVDILVATPGRLLDLMQRRFVDLSNIEVLCFDEADRMLDMGFINDVRKIVAKIPDDRQVLFFSATMTKSVNDLAQQLCKDPLRIDVAPVAVAKPKIEQRLMFVEPANKQALLTIMLKNDPNAMALVFSRTKHRADRIVTKLRKAKIRADAIHSNKTQGARQRALANFADGKARVLVATDIAARGIDVDGVSHVFNFDLSDEPENHVHRIGRTGRAGATGLAISFCGREEIKKLVAIEKLGDEAIKPDDGHDFHDPDAMRAYITQATEGTKKKSRSGKRGGWPKPRRRRVGGSRRR